jgi:hypothetical protein
MLSVAATCLLSAALSPTAFAAELQYVAGKQNVVVFPVKNGIGEDKAQMASDFQVLLKDALSLTGQFAVMTCDINSNVSVQRAVAEQKVKADDFKTGFSTDPQGVARAQKVCQAIATDLGVISSLDTYSFNETTKEAKIVITVQLIKGIPDEKPFTIAVTGMAVGKPDDGSQTESGIAISALDDACNKVISEISNVSPTALSAGLVGQGQEVDKPKSRNKGLLSAMLGALLLGLALGGK